MPRDFRAYLTDIIAACDAISSYLESVSFTDFLATREKRSAVEREFITIGEAMAQLSRLAPECFNRLSNGPKAIAFRNVLAHNYAAVDEDTVYDTALVDVPKLRSECEQLLTSPPPPRTGSG